MTPTAAPAASRATADGQCGSRVRRVRTGPVPLKCGVVKVRWERRVLPEVRMGRVPRAKVSVRIPICAEDLTSAPRASTPHRIAQLGLAGALPNPAGAVFGPTSSPARRPLLRGRPLLPEAARAAAHDQARRQVHPQRARLLPRLRSSTSRAAASAISVSGCRTVVSGGPIQRATGRSSKPTTLRSSRDAQAQLAGGLVEAERLEVVAGEDGGGPVGAAQQLAGPGGSRPRGGSRRWRSGRGRRAARGLQRGPVAVDPGAAAHHPRGPADHADPAVAEFDAGGGSRRGRPASWWRRWRARRRRGRRPGPSPRTGCRGWSAAPAGPRRARTAPGSRRAGGGRARRPAQVWPGVSRPADSESTTLRPSCRATFSTPRMTSIAQALSSSWKTRSISGEPAARSPRRRW